MAHEMKEIKNYTSLELEIRDKKIVKIFNLNSNKFQRTFTKPLTEKRYKLYAIKENKKILYIGITRQSLSSRFRLGLSADGGNGYHGYKWKDMKKVKVLVWFFDNYNKNQLESIEAELVYLVRNKTNRWPRFQNEIHFNNNFAKGKKVAEQIFELIKDE